MFTIADGRDRLYQWDADVKLLIDENVAPTVDEAHFRSKYSKDNVPIPVKVVRTDTESYVMVPNVLLQSSYNIIVYAYCCTSKNTRHTQELIVVARPKPVDYVYTEEEVLTYRNLAERVEALEKNQGGGQQPGSALPPVTEEDNGKLLLVENGVWNLVPSTRFVKNKIAINSFTVSPGQAEIGSNVREIILTWVTNMRPTKLYLDGDELGETFKDACKYGYWFGSEASAQKSNRTWKLKVEDDQGEVAEKSVTLSFLNGVYYGATTQPESIDSAFILGFTKTLASSRARTIDVTAGEGQYIWYALPVRLGKCTFAVGGFAGGFDLVDTIDFTNAKGYTESYYVYRSGQANLGATKVVIS